MHDFDEARLARYEEDRKFKLGGEIFTHRPAVRPELMAAYEDLGTTATAHEALQVLDDLIVAWIDPTDDPDAVERYHALRAREEDPIGGSDLSQLVSWLYRQSTRRPTSAPTSSEDGRVTTGTNSTDGSSAEPAVASEG
jgi:hypothetical protein